MGPRCSFALLVLVPILAGCSSVSGKLEPAAKRPGTHRFQAGAAKVDITPLPGIPMGGHSVAGAVSRGWWTRLHARALYLEGEDGTCLVMVSCDLWSIPGGLADRVAERVQQNPALRHLGREHLLLAATHTHQSPGNFSTSPYYNAHASRWSGFDPDLFDFLAVQIADCVVRAASRKQPATLDFAENRLPGFFRNRSFEAFLLNPESRAILLENSDLPPAEVSSEFPDADAARAVNPTVSVLRVTGADGRNLALAAFLNVHPTAMGNRTEVYQSDVFGVAATLVEQQLRAPGSDPVVAVFNGAEGDQTTWWTRQDRLDTLRLGSQLATNLLALAQIQHPVSGPITVGFNRVTLRNRAFIDVNGTPRRTDSRAFPGIATLGGAEDGRSFAADLGFREGVRGTRETETQGAKQPALDPVFFSSKSSFSLTRFVMGFSQPPAEVPLAVYHVGPILLASLPGEFTMTMGRRIARQLAATSQPQPERVLLVGPANEYVSYFTTPEEYDAQHYEGASTLYGPASGPLVLRELGELAAGSTTHLADRYHYATGGRKRFGPRELKAQPFEPDDGLANILLSRRDGRPLRGLPFFQWKEPLPIATHGAARLAPKPEVRLEVLDTNGAWTSLQLDRVPEDDTGLNLVTVLLSTTDNTMTWSVVWMPPESVDTGAEYRFKVKTASGTEVASPALRVTDAMR